MAAHPPPKIRNSEFGIRNFRPPTPWNSEFRIRNAPANPDRSRERAGALTGSAWHPDSPRIGVPGILSGSALREQHFETSNAMPKPVLGGTKDTKETT